MDFPVAFTTADATAMDSQRQFMLLTRFQLLLLIVAGAAGLFALRTSRLDVAALIAGGAFATAALLRFALLRRGLHRRWYEARAAAESIKTLSYRYAFGGGPFDLSRDGAEGSFAEQVSDVVTDLRTLENVPTADAMPTERMRLLRERSLGERKAGYRATRIEDQVGWYARKAEWNRRRAGLWGVSILLLQVAGAAGAFLKGFGVVNVDVFGLAAALVGSAAAWLETRQHGSLSSAYSVTADELRNIAALVDAQGTEEDWARFVAEAEEAISREHTMWKASNSQRRPASLA